MAVRLILVDDHAVVRHGLRMFLALDPDIDVIGEANDGAEAVRLAHDLMPNVVLMDLLMPVMDGITATEIIRREMPDVEVLALTSVLEDEKVYAAMRAGAIGYMLKDTQPEELCNAIKAAAEGQVQLSPAVVERLIEETEAGDRPRPSLGERETEILKLLARGQGDSEIAHTLSVKPQTVRPMISAVLDKLGVASRTQAAVYALRNGLVPLDEAGRR